MQIEQNESLVIIIPLPNRVLSPNYMTGSISGRMAKAKAAKKQREHVCKNLEFVCRRNWGKILVEPTFYHKTRRKRDTDNAIGSLKSAYDGIVDSRIVLDDTPEYFIRGEPKFLIDKNHPRVELRITRMK